MRLIILLIKIKKKSYDTIKAIKRQETIEDEPHSGIYKTLARVRGITEVPLALSSLTFPR